MIRSLVRGILFASLAAGLAGCAGTDTASFAGPVTAETEAEIIERVTGTAPRTDAALLVFYRPMEVWTGDNDYSVWIGERRIGVLPTGTSLAHVAEPGPLSIRLKTVPNLLNLGLGLLVMRAGPVDVMAEAGNTLYFEVAAGMMMGEPTIRRVDARQALPQLSQTRLAGLTPDGSAAPRREPGIVVVLVPPQGTLPRRAEPGRLVIPEAVDARDDTGRIGERFAAFGVSMGNVYADRSVAGFVRDAIEARLAGAGFELAEGTPGRVLGITLERFWFDTDTTPLYWDVNGEIAVRLELGGGGPSAGFTCRATERAYLAPDAALFGRVVQACMAALLGDVAGWDALGAIGEG